MWIATECALGELENTAWLCDGTFKSSTQIWTWLFTVHVIIHNTFLSLMCFLYCQIKEKKVTRDFFVALLQLCPSICSSNSLINFEKGIYNALWSVFPNYSISDRLFRFGQSCWRKICEIGRESQYNNDSVFALKIKCFDALAFLPPSKVIAAFEPLPYWSPFSQ